MIAADGDHQIVEDSAARVGEKRISLATFAEPQHVDGNKLLKCERARPHIAACGAQCDLPHVRHIEQPRCRAGVEVLLEDADRIMDRHLVAGERRHARAEFNMQRIKRRAQRRSVLQTDLLSRASESTWAPLSASTDCPGAPSVCLPENVIPSAGASSATFQSLDRHRSVLLPESFRGGCSFGAGKRPISPAAMRKGVSFSRDSPMYINLCIL